MEKPVPAPNTHRPEWIVVTSFGLAILLGALLLSLPISSHDGRWTRPVDALFTAASATCVTGLVVVDTGTYFSVFGQVVILVLIQLGGLGVMTLGTFFLLMVGRRLSLHQELVLLDSIGAKRARGLTAIIVLTVLFSLAVQMAGTVILAGRFAAHGFSPARSIYLAVFHAGSAFCNAGFALFEDSLMSFSGDPGIVLTITVLIIVGGLGFLVVHNLLFLRPWRRDCCKRGSLSLHTRTVLLASAVLILAGWVLFGVLEWRGTLATLSWPVKLMTALFHSVTPRTAGFNIVDMGAVSTAGQFLTMILMFIGGGSGSTAGGIKVTTAVVLLFTMIVMIRGREEVVLGRRSVSVRVIREALSIFVLCVLCVIGVYGALLVVEQNNLLAQPGTTPFDLLFETVSAFGTVGLSTGVTAGLSTAGKLLIAFCMFIGRLGPMTLALVIGRRQLAQVISYPEEEIIVG